MVGVVDMLLDVLVDAWPVDTVLCLILVLGDALVSLMYLM